MKIEEFRKHAHELVDWTADYLENIEQYPVKSQVNPGDIINQLPLEAPQEGEEFTTIFEDFKKIILPGMTHWQHPAFFAYFPANISGPSLLGEMLTSALGAQCMIWDTSPAAAELEERTMDWLKKICGLPESWVGVIQDSASTATLCAILSAREKASGFKINENGYRAEGAPFAVYCSTETHSSVEKAIKIAGLGKNALRKVKVDENYALIPEDLERTILADLAQGIKPLCVIAAIGTTSSTAIDPLSKMGDICQRFGIWLHVDAAYAGTAAILPEKRWILSGIEKADSYVFNPHKWMFTHFDCSAYFVKDPQILTRTFEILPEYLKTAHDHRVKNYRDWGVQLGRRFRALKLWFVLRSFGVKGLQDRIRHHIELAQYFVSEIKKIPGFEILAPVPLNLVCFRFNPSLLSDTQAPLKQSDLDLINSRLLEKLNGTGKVYLTHTRLAGKYAIRIAIGQTEVKQSHVDVALQLLTVFSKETRL